MAAEVASALELLQAPILNPLKLEVVMTKADHLTKSLSLHWKAGRVVENPSGCLVVYPPTLHLRKHEEEEVIVEEVIEEQKGVMEQDQSSPLVRRTQNIDVENQNMTIQNAVIEDDDADVVIEEDDADVVIEEVYEDVVIEENNNEVDLFGTADLGILNGGTAEEKYANDLEHLSSGVAAVKDLNGGEVKCLLESSGEEEPGMEENLQELSVSRSQDQNLLSIEAEQKGSCLLIEVETSQQVQAGGNVQYRPALPPPQPLDLQLCELPQVECLSNPVALPPNSSSPWPTLAMQRSWSLPCRRWNTPTCLRPSAKGNLSLSTMVTPGAAPLLLTWRGAPYSWRRLTLVASSLL